MAPIRITYATALVLQAIHTGRRYGWDIMDASGLPDGTVYPALRRLERGGHLTANWESLLEATAAKRPPRKYYDLTPEGLNVLNKAAQRFHGLHAAMAPDLGGQS